MAVHATLPFRRFSFASAGVLFVKPRMHEDRMMELTEQIRTGHITVQGADIETAAAWTVACDLWNMPPAGWA
jgi:hypothetical protein